MSAVPQEIPAAPTKIDLGCGPNPKPGFHGVDSIAFPGVGTVLKIGSEVWPWADSSIEEAHCSHTLEHLTNYEGKWERTHFFNELYRVLKPDAGCLLIIPHWASQRYYGDPTHKEPFSEFAFYYLDRAWRKANAPHADIEHNPHGYDCDFPCTWNWNIHPSLQGRTSEYQQWALQHLVEARQDLVATVKARK